LVSFFPVIVDANNMRQQRVSVSQKTGEYAVAPLPAFRLEKRRGSDDEFIAPPALQQHQKMLEDSRKSSFTRILLKRDEGTKDKEKITPPALDRQKKMEKASSNAARSVTRLLPQTETREQGQVLPQRTEGTRDLDDQISPVLKQLKTLESIRSNAEKSFTLVLPERVEEARDASQHSKASQSDIRDETDDDRLEGRVSYPRDDDDEDFFGRPTTPPRKRIGSLLDDLVPVRWLNNKGSRATDEVQSDAFELVLIVWTTHTLKVKVVDEQNQQVAVHSSYFKHDEMEEVEQVSSKPLEEEPPPALIPTDTWALTRNSNSIAVSAAVSEEEADESALGSFLCGMFCHENDIHEIDSSSTLGPDDIPSEISYHSHHHRHHHAHSSKMNGVPSSELPTATSMVVSDVSSNSTDASDWSSESSECSSVLSRPEATCKPVTRASQLVSQKWRWVKKGRWKKLR
jgi:hypothetical protein